MRLLINTSSTFKGGGVQNAKSFIEECINFPENEYHVVLGPSLEGKLKLNTFPKNFYFYKINFRPATKVFSLKSQSKFFVNLEQEIKPDIIFTTSGPAYWKPKAPHLVGYNLPHYIYPESPFFNLIPITKKIKWRLKGIIIKYYFKRDSEYYVVQTDDVNKRLRTLIKKENVFTVSNTCNRYYYDPKIYPGKLPPRNKDEFRLLLFSAYYHHKNFEIIPGIIDELSAGFKERIKFVVTLEKNIFEKVFPPEYHKYIFNIGPVKIEEGPSLYNECDAMFLPTLLECFSASYPEAMIMGKPIITTDLGFARSICGDAALYYSAIDASDAAKKIVELISNPKLQSELIAKGKERIKIFLKPGERAKEYLRICESILDGK